MGYTYRYFGAFRLLLAGLVMFQHFAADLAPEDFARLCMPYDVGNTAVLVFFALSGFVIIEAADQVYGGKPLAFMANRLLRILPHFIVAVALSMLLHYVFAATEGERLWRSQPGFPFDAAFAPANVLLNFVDVLPLIDRFVGYQFLDIVWAVRVEMVFYFVVFLVLGCGRLVPWARSLGRTAGIALVLLAPGFFLAMHGRAPAMLSFVPYFAFGCALYFAAKGCRTGWLVMLTCVPPMIWRFRQYHSENPLMSADERSTGAGLVLLATLLTGLAILAFSRFSGGRRSDRYLGNLTYPLYLYHEDILVLLLTFTVGYSHGVFAAGLLLSVLVAAGAAQLVDPAMNRFRDRVRGSSVDGTAIMQGSSPTEVVAHDPALGVPGQLGR